MKLKIAPTGKKEGEKERPAAPTGREAFVLGNHDAAATLADCVYARDAARFIDFPCFPSNYHCCRENTAETVDKGNARTMVSFLQTVERTLSHEDV